jgi:hypothetical protein
MLPLAIAATLVLAGCGDSSSKDKAGASPYAPATTPATTSATTSSSTPPAGQPPKLDSAFGSMDKLPGILKTKPPWSANAADLQLRLRAIGLPALSAEGQVLHIHQHLDIFVDGKAVAIPGNIGIGPGSTFISPLHTHGPPNEPSIMHVESPTEASFSLGQFFAVWGLRLDATCIGGVCEGNGKQMRVWVNGNEVPGDPTRVVLDEHQEIVIAVGTAKQMPDPVPVTYDFASAGV